MAAGKSIVAARAAAIPEVVRNGILVEPGNPEALAEAIGRLHRDTDLRRSLGGAGLRDVEDFERIGVAQRFLSEIAMVAPVFQVAESKITVSRAAKTEVDHIGWDVAGSGHLADTTGSTPRTVLTELRDGRRQRASTIGTRF